MRGFLDLVRSYIERAVGCYGRDAVETAMQLVRVTYFKSCALLEIVESAPEPRSDLPWPMVGIHEEERANLVGLATVPWISEGVECSLCVFVWDDEYVPNPVLDALYRVVRRSVFGRSHDYEAVMLCVDGHARFWWPAGWGFEEVGTYTDAPSYDALPPRYDLHQRVAKPLEDFDWVRGRPVVYVATWNHSMREKPLGGRFRVAAPPRVASIEEVLSYVPRSGEIEDQIVEALRSFLR